jgi:hypothetical protein
MSCIVCNNLEQIFKTKQQEYVEACSAPYYRFSKKFAAYKNVDMERARYELEEHRLICVSAPNVSAYPDSTSTVLHTAKWSPWRSSPKRHPDRLSNKAAVREPNQANANYGRQKPAFSS